VGSVLKLFLKKCGGKKIKNIGSGLSVGLLAVLLQYGLYVVGYLSKWFVLFWSFVGLFNGCTVGTFKVLTQQMFFLKVQHF